MRRCLWSRNIKNWCSIYIYIYIYIYNISCLRVKSSTWSSHVSLGLPTGLDVHGFHLVTFLTILVVSILITCAAHRNLCNFINLTIFFLLIRISNSSFVFILHVPSLSNVGPYIFLTTFLNLKIRSIKIYLYLVPGTEMIGVLILPPLCLLVASTGTTLLLPLPWLSSHTVHHCGGFTSSS